MKKEIKKPINPAGIKTRPGVSKPAPKLPVAGGGVKAPIKKPIAKPGVKAPVKKPATGGGFPAIKPAAKPGYSSRPGVKAPIKNPVANKKK